MAGHATKHPYLKTYDELKRSTNRMRLYLDMHGSLIPAEERKDIESIIDLIDEAIMHIPGKYHVTRFHQFKNKD